MVRLPPSPTRSAFTGLLSLPRALPFTLLFPLLFTLLFTLPTPALAAPDPSLFDGGWDERDPYRADLTAEAWEAARTLEGVTVYHLDLDLDPSLTSARARQEVLVTNRDLEPLDALYFHLFPNLLGGRLEVEHARVDGRAVEAVAEGALLHVPVGRPIPPGDAVVVALEFTLEVPVTEGRNYGIFAFQDGVLSLAHGYALLAARRGDAWDLDPPAPYGDLTYSEVGFYRVRLRAPSDVEVVTTGIELTRDVQGDAQTLTFAAGPVRDFFVSVGVDYRRRTRAAGATTLRVFATEAQRARAERVLDSAEAALAIFGERFSPYPHREFDIVPITTGALGIEFPGIIALSSDLLERGADPGVLEGTIAHEVAHQWFYGLVGNDQVSEPWLDEAVTQYATLLYFGERYGPPGEDGFRRSLQARWARVGERVEPIGAPAPSYSQQDYGAIVYGLGPLVIEDLGAAFTADAFAEFWRDYIATFRWRTVDTEAFRDLAERSCGCDLGPFFETWIYPR